MNKKIFNLFNVSKARNLIYGLTIMWIIFFHSGLNVSCSILKTIKNYGDCGVEIFFILSGVCLFFSFSKVEKVFPFYKRRLKRIIPSYLIIYTTVFLIFDIFQQHAIKQFLLDITMLDFWLHGLGRVPWFVAGIIIFYLMYPLIYSLLYKEYACKKLLLPLVLLLILLLTFKLSNTYEYLRIFFIRIPSFITGCVLGKVVKDKKEFKVWHLLMLIILLISTYFLFHYKKDIWWTRNLFYIPLALSLILTFSLLYKLLRTYLKSITIILEFLGTISLELYLLHEKIQENLFKLLSHIGVIVNFNNLLYQITCINIAIFLGFLINIITKRLTKKKKFISNF